MGRPSGTATHTPHAQDAVPDRHHRLRGPQVAAQRWWAVRAQPGAVVLREESQSLDIEVTVRATPRGDGFDRVRYRNGVREPLDEAGVEAQEELS